MVSFFGRFTLGKGLFARLRSETCNRNLSMLK